MADEEKDLKRDPIDPSGKGQPEKPVVETEEDDELEADELDTEANNESDEEETTTISKAELTKLQEERDNYKKGMLLAKNKGRKLPEIGNAPEKSSEKEFDWERDHESEYVTKKDFQKKEERAAINKAVESLPELDTNWDDIIEYYYPKRGKDDADNIVADLEDAVDLWKLRTGRFNKDDGKKDIKKATAKIAADEGVSKGKERNPTPPRKSLFKKSVPMERWYDNR